MDFSAKSRSKFPYQSQLTTVQLISHILVYSSIVYIQWRIEKFRKGVYTGARSVSEHLLIATPTSGTLAVRTEYFQATLGLVKCLEISNKLIRECVTVLLLLHATAA